MLVERRQPRITVKRRTVLHFYPVIAEEDYGEGVGELRVVLKEKLPNLGPLVRYLADV